MVYSRIARASCIFSVYGTITVDCDVYYDSLRVLPSLTWPVSN